MTGQAGPTYIDGQPVPGSEPQVATIEREPKLPATRPSNLPKELVVATYKEDLSWLGGLPIHATIYNKGGDVVPGSITLANTGREAGTILFHITKYYGSLANWTYFVQGSPHGDDLPGRMQVDYADATSLTKEYKPDFPGAEAKALDLVEVHGGYEVRYGSAAFHGDRSPETNGPWLSRVWDHWFDCPPPDDWVFGYAAEWVVPRERILARPLSFWRSALRQVNKANDQSNYWNSDPASPWALELIWKYLFSDPQQYPTKEFN